MHWHHQGHGQVDVTTDNEYILFREHILLDNGTTCRDEKRWHWQAPVLHFERLREGRFQQIFTFRQSSGQFLLQQPHLCGPDTYTAELTINAGTIDLLIQITGLRKQEVLQYQYQ